MPGALHALLKESTRSRHEQAEGHPFQGALVHGKLPLESCRLYMGQLYALHEYYEGQLQQFKDDTVVRAVLMPEYFQLRFLKQDLEHLKAPADTMRPLPCVNAFSQLPIWTDTPAALAGILYVILGSKHGGKFIAHRLKETYGPQGGAFSYFDPYGEQFRGMWQKFTGDLNALDLDGSAEASILSGANATFDIFGEISDAIWRLDKQTC